MKHKSERDCILLLPRRKFLREETFEMELSSPDKIRPSSCLRNPQTTAPMTQKVSRVPERGWPADL